MAPTQIPDKNQRNWQKFQRRWGIMQNHSGDPITAVCVVADPNKCPPSYDLLMKSTDRRDDCDLWKDSGMFKSSKVTRYLCVSRVVSPDGGRLYEVLADIIIQNDREVPPPGYRMIEKTVDTLERALKKKQICVKMLPASSTTDAIGEIILLSRSRRPPTGYSLAGDINGLVICYKMCKVTLHLNQVSSSSSCQQNATQLTGSPNHSAPRQDVPLKNSVNHVEGHGDNGFSTGGALERSDSSQGLSPLAGVSFQLNPKFSDEISRSRMRDTSDITFNYKSLIDIENEFSYTFSLENSAIIQRPSSITSS